MKKLLTIILLTLSASAMAQHNHHHGGHNRGNWGWGPIIGGAVMGAVIYDIYNRPVVVQQPPIIYQQQPVIIQQQNCTPWTETQNSDGSITRTRTCNQ